MYQLVSIFFMNLPTVRVSSWILHFIYDGATVAVNNQACAETATCEEFRRKRERKLEKEIANNASLLLAPGSGRDSKVQTIRVKTAIMDSSYVRWLWHMDLLRRFGPLKTKGNKGIPSDTVDIQRSHFYQNTDRINNFCQNSTSFHDTTTFLLLISVMKWLSLSTFGIASNFFFHYYAATSAEKPPKLSRHSPEESVDDAHSANSVGGCDSHNIEPHNLTRALSHFLTASADNTQGRTANCIILLGLLPYPKGWLLHRGHSWS